MEINKHSSADDCWDAVQQERSVNAEKRSQPTDLQGQERQLTGQTPWRIAESKVPGYERVISIVDNNGLGVCSMYGGGSYNPAVLQEVRAKARLIVAAVNSLPHVVGREF